MVKRVKDAQGNTIHDGMWRKVYTYELMPGKIRGELASAVLKAAMKNVVRDSFAKVYGSKNSTSKKRRREDGTDEVRSQYTPKRPAGAAKSTKPMSISISKFFLRKTASAPAPTQQEESKASNASIAQKGNTTASATEGQRCFVATCGTTPQGVKARVTSDSPPRRQNYSKRDLSKSGQLSLKPCSETMESSASVMLPHNRLFRRMEPSPCASNAKAFEPLSTDVLASRGKSAPHAPGARTLSLSPTKAKDTYSSPSPPTSAPSRNSCPNSNQRKPLTPTTPPSISARGLKGSTGKSKIHEDTFMSPASSACSSSKASKHGSHSSSFVPSCPSSASKKLQHSNANGTTRSLSGVLGTASLRRRRPSPQISKDIATSIPSPTPSSTTDIALKALAETAAFSVKFKRVDDSCDKYQVQNIDDLSTGKASGGWSHAPPQNQSRVTTTPPSDNKMSKRLAAFGNPAPRDDDDITPRKKLWRQELRTFREKPNPSRRPMSSTTPTPTLQQTPMDAWLIPRKRKPATSSTSHRENPSMKQL
ncbi:hypothetical protein, variant [Aphanomyces invadans]|nr:hypothetical protein, variant [Aphanomyces invadans]ETV96270.1 hypothetical protein, variant [Aphanomyces invadans]|eukprot:XP_008875062.1 hypothetical protein, variant [Aphanomyces invadans]